MEPTIIIIDDDIDTVDCLRMALRRQSYTVLGAITGAKGLELARQHRARLVVTDVMMPDMDGYEVCRRLRADPDVAHVAILLLSGRGALADQAAGIEAGADRYLVKPVTLRDFSEAVEELLAHPARAGAHDRGQG